MSGYVIVHGHVTNGEKMQEYGAAAGPIVGQFGGEVISRGPSEILSGASDHNICVVIKFADKAAAKKWYESPEYQALIPTREQGLDSVFFLTGE
ncbi:MAG: hypothetical protein ACI9BW_004696 [Gammaproteobacteria bacterium]|jgi:uncharacterized protein (DUF1330 family)